MVEEINLARCPKCKQIVQPRGYDVSRDPTRDSNLRWCDKCFSGEKRWDWRFVTNIHGE